MKTHSMMAAHCLCKHPTAWFTAAVAGVALALCPPAHAQSRQKMFVAFDAPAKALLSKMTLEEKIGQMCQPDQSALKT
ncbi:MAG TPA: hypothetical protein VN765_01775, partial [Candidatus Acidoferrum sp.]|nr:hypothetical protein [Candidatus Acidoferrum sp.]